jgi:branched-chain amino acid transport system permease protein
MTDLTAHSQIRPHAQPSRFGAVLPWLVVGLILVAGWVLLAVPNLQNEGETLTMLLATPDIWIARLGPGLASTLPGWATLTLAGLAMGMMIFVMGAGMTLVFGLMNVINFGHGALVSLGAFVGVSALVAASAWFDGPDPWLTLAPLGAAVLGAMLAAGAAGAVFERGLAGVGHGAQVRQILVTVGGLVIAEQLIRMVWGPAELVFTRPEILQRTVVVQGIALDTYRLMAVAVGAVVLSGLLLVLSRTRIGLILRAGMENGEMLEAMGYNLRRVFTGVFVAGSALAGLGGVLWALDQQVVSTSLGGEVIVLVFTAVLIGGRGSVTGCFIAALMIGLVHTYIAHVHPGFALVSTVVVLGLVMLWRPAGLMPQAAGRQQ